MKEVQCPNCGASGPKKISEGEFLCQFCNTHFYDQALLQRKRSAEKLEAQAKAMGSKQHFQREQIRNSNRLGKRVLIFVAIALVLVFVYVGYMAKRSMDQSTKMQEELIKSFKQD
jgi:uncharacterized membrane protein YvbJ